jgi:hypothetical protein
MPYFQIAARFSEQTGADRFGESAGIRFGHPPDRCGAGWQGTIDDVGAEAPQWVDTACRVQIVATILVTRPFVTGSNYQ